MEYFCHVVLVLLLKYLSTSSTTANTSWNSHQQCLFFQPDVFLFFLNNFSLFSEALIKSVILMCGSQDESLPAEHYATVNSTSTSAKSSTFSLGNTFSCTTQTPASHTKGVWVWVCVCVAYNALLTLWSAIMDDKIICSDSHDGFVECNHCQTCSQSQEILYVY